MLRRTRLLDEMPHICPYCGESIRYSSFGTPVGYRCGSELGIYPSTEIEKRSPACVVIADLRRELALLKGERVL
jgi:hypothetical protein